jgi:L-fuculose-phosphate aldolase
VSMLRREVAEVYRDLGRLGLNTGSTGNVSARTRHGMVITQTGATAETVNPESLIAMSLDGTIRKPAGNAGPSSEWAMHAAIYAADPAAKAIVHTHADACTALACLNEDLPAFHYMIASFGGEDVRCAPYVTFGTPELAVLATAALAGRSACLLANHGMIVHAVSPRQALNAALRLETLCRQYLLARSAGTPRLLTEDEMTAAMRRFETYAAGNG